MGRGRRCGAALAAAGLLAVAGCARLAPHAAAVPDAAPGAVVTLFTAADAHRDVSDLRVLAAAPLPDGTVVVQWDPHALTAGDDRPPWSDPQLSVLGADDTVEPLALPDGVGSASAGPPSLLGTDAAGRIYLWARTGGPGGLVVRGTDLSWQYRRVALDTSFVGVPQAAPGGAGAVYLAADDGVYRLAPDGTVQLLVAVHGLIGSEDRGASALPADQPPVPARSMTLSAVLGLAVGRDSTVFVSTRSEIVAIDPDGMLSLVTTFGDLQRALGIQSTLDPPYLWSALAIDADGSLLVSDRYQQLVADLDGPAIVARNAVVVSNGLDASRGPQHDLLLRLLDPDGLRAGPSLPDQLAAFGR